MEERIELHIRNLVHKHGELLPVLREGNVYAPQYTFDPVDMDLMIIELTKMVAGGGK